MIDMSDLVYREPERITNEWLNPKVKLLSPTATVPTRGSADAAGLDLYAANEQPIRIPAHETRKIKTGIAMAIPKGLFGALFARSGIATKQGLRPANCVGVIDADYRGEIIVALHNDCNTVQTISPGDRIAQLVFLPSFSLDCTVVDELDETTRGSGGFGSTGK